MANIGKRNIETFKNIFNRFETFYWNNDYDSNNSMKYAGLTKDTFERLIKHESISLDSLITVCKVCKLSSDFLLGFSNDPSISSDENLTLLYSNPNTSESTNKNLSYQIFLNDANKIDVEIFEHMIGITETDTRKERYERVINWFYKIIEEK